MSDHDVSRLLHDPRVQHLFAMRRRRYVGLSLAVSIVYGIVALLCAFAPELLVRPINGSAVSLGIASMVAVIVVGIACSGYYTWWSNTVRDPLAAEILTSGAGRKA